MQAIMVPVHCRHAARSMTINSDDLEYFIRVASTGSFSRAALELGTDPSALSRHMARLEGAYHARLFHRSGRGVVLTEAGMVLLEQARQVAASLQQARHALHGFASKGPRQVVIAAQPTIARMSFGRVGRALKAQFPETRVRFVEGLGTHILEWLASGEIDIAILYMPAHAGGLKVDMLLREPVRLVMPAHYANEGDTFDTARLGELPLILPSTPHGLRLLAESLASRAGAVLNIALECDGSTSVTKRLVEERCGCTILPLAAVATEVAQGRLRTARLVNPEVVRDVAIATAKNRPPVAQLWNVIQTIRGEVVDCVTAGDWPDAELIHSAELAEASRLTSTFQPDDPP